jgi:hypothetical protein
VGTDLVVDLAQADGANVAHGVALDDYLGSDARIAVDAEAGERYGRWRLDKAESLTIDGVDLIRIWEVEMMAQCFQPAARLLHGLPRALDAFHPSCLEIRSLDAGTTRLARAIAAAAGIAATTDADGPCMREPIPRAKPSRLAIAAASLGTPPRLRGEVVCVPYWHLYPAIAALAARDGHMQPVASRLLLPGLGRRRAVALAARGGWLGLPGRRMRAASRAAVSAAVSAAVAGRIDDSLDCAIDSHALETLRRLAQDTLAHVWQARRALAAGRARLGLVPYDSDEHVRMLLCALGEAGIPALLVQHGFPARQGDPDMRTAQHLAIWSEHERSLVPERDPGTVTVTGNPGATHLAGWRPAGGVRSARSVVLVDYPGRLTARIDARVGPRHVAVALAALAAARPRSVAVIRPHPSDLRPASYARIADAQRDLRVEIDMGTPIEALLGGADLCIGALSTATLQACALGIPTVFLDVAGIERPWPFDGSALPMRTDADGLAGAIATALATRQVAGREAALDALGVRRDAVERVVELACELARR